MNVCNTNRLRITVTAPMPWTQPPRVSRFRSNDHDRGAEHNYCLTFGPLFLIVKWRPNGKRRI